ncbi:uncharacterized protein F4812DRAFT_463454 [Daldinia caldariorum]|uniref:uncharacterized protein n=1 Tax=Daldinia caldariorum TaxID=326644 RepID=UPI0020088027|nr:uncharacterized protein F4812DRAFT_463454 [Daldinia caldariorum]KAI1463626.1 hypothetical protein F4812DRAFT_463454 [Daldinia caldariorum]
MALKLHASVVLRLKVGVTTNNRSVLPVGVGVSSPNAGGLNVWRRFSDLVTDLYAVGLHREVLRCFATSPAVLGQARSRLSPEYRWGMGILTRCNEAWSSLPTHHKYHKDYSNSNLPSTVRLMLGKVYLAYLHIIFQLRRLPGQGRMSYELELMEISKNILANAQIRFFRYPHSIPTVCCHPNIGAARYYAKPTKDSPAGNKRSPLDQKYLRASISGMGDFDSIGFGDFNNLDFETWVMDINLNRYDQQRMEYLTDSLL